MSSLDSDATVLAYCRDSSELSIICAPYSFPTRFSVHVRTSSLTLTIWSIEHHTLEPFRLTLPVWIPLHQDSSRIKKMTYSSRFEITPLLDKVILFEFLARLTLICKVFEKKKILDDQALKTWLGDQSNTSSVIPACVGPAAAKKDPKCRFMQV